MDRFNLKEWLQQKLEKFLFIELSSFKKIIYSILLSITGFFLILFIHRVTGLFAPIVTIVVALIIPIFGQFFFGTLLIIILAFTCDFFFIEPIGKVLGSLQGIQSFFILCVISIAMSFVMSTLLNLIKKSRAFNIENEKMVEIIKNSDDAIISKDLNGIITSWNKGAENIFGYTQEEVIDKSITIIIPPHLYREEEDILNRLKKGETLSHYETMRLTKDGRILNISLTSSPIKDTHGTVVGISKIARDITTQKEAEKKFNKLHAELEHRVVERTKDLQLSNNELERFAYVASHDLQTPLRHISYYNDLILEKAVQAKLDISEENKIIKSGIERMRNLIKSILTYSRVGRFNEFTCEEVDLNKVINDVLEIMKLNIKEHSAQIRIDPIMATVYGNDIMLMQVFQNLLENAIKFCFKERSPIVQIESISKGEFLEIAVKDNGIGIDPEYYEQAFEVFHRLNSLEEFQGTGVGLSICKKIVNRHGGKIWPESKKGQGSTFFFTLPLFKDFKNFKTFKKDNNKELV